VTTESHDCLKINCPELFADPLFLAWLNEGAKADGGHIVATWHRPGAVGEYCDVFVTYDHGDGSDSPVGCYGWPDGPAMPEACWEKLDAACKEAALTCGVLWLTNLGE
jgi:hypothetical protein